MTLANIWYQNVAFVLGNIQEFFGIFKSKIKKWPVIPNKSGPQPHESEL